MNKWILLKNENKSLKTFFSLPKCVYFIKINKLKLCKIKICFSFIAIYIVQFRANFYI